MISKIIPLCVLVGIVCGVANATEDTIYGYKLMDALERAEYRAEMRSIESEQERAEFLQEHKELMDERAREQGVQDLSALKDG